jgi:hypothetical protein
MDEVGVKVVGLEGLGIGTAFLWHGRPLKRAKNGAHSNWGGHHRLKRRRQEDVLAGRLPSWVNIVARAQKSPITPGGDVGQKCIA